VQKCSVTKRQLMASLPRYTWVLSALIDKKSGLHSSCLFIVFMLQGVFNIKRVMSP